MNAMTDIPPEAATEHAVQTRLGRLHVVACGQGEETILLWPSIFTDHHIYDALAESFRDRFRLLLIDGPGHGRSDGTAEEFSMRSCGEAILSVLDHFRRRQAVIGGTSWGGLAAAEAALAAPERVKSLILMNTPMDIDGARPGLSARMIASGARWSGRRRFFQTGVARSFFSPGALAANPAYRRDFHSMLAAADQKSLATAVRSVILRGTPLRLRMAQISVPVLVIAGKADDMYPIEGQAEAALLAPQGYFEAVDGKHISVVESPRHVAEIIDRHLTDGAVQ
ncbi:MAG: alpha/beta hydrolase [Pseudomonadota bacterium]